MISRQSDRKLRAAYVANTGGKTRYLGRTGAPSSYTLFSVRSPFQQDRTVQDEMQIERFGVVSCGDDLVDPGPRFTQIS